MTACPDTNQLRRLEAGELADEEADALIPHVGACVACTEALERFRRENLDTRVLRTALSEAGVSSSSTGVMGQSQCSPPSTATDLSPTPEGWGTAAMSVTTPGAGLETSQSPTPEGWGSHAQELKWAIPDYERVRLCGEGAFGTVWAVRDRVGLFRALKTLDLTRLSTQKARCRESTALEVYCRLVGRHPNLIEVFHVGVQGHLLYYTMELADDDRTHRPVRGEFPADYRPLTLQRIIAQGPVRAETAIEVVLRLLRGLARLHSLGLAHRDIKPSNVVFVGRRPKLADIGMITADTATPSQVGTPDYMPPDRRMDPTADVYAMGRMLYELMVGQAGTEFPRLPAKVVRAAEGWDMARVQAVFDAACAGTAEARYPHAARMLEELEACRELPFDALFGDLAHAEKAPARESHPYRPYVLAAIHALPWVLGLVLAIVLAIALTN